MEKIRDAEGLLRLLEPHKSAEREWFLSLLDDEKQAAYESEHIRAVMKMLKIARILPHKRKIDAAKAELAKIEKKGNPSAEEYRRINGKLCYWKDNGMFEGELGHTKKR